MILMTLLLACGTPDVPAATPVTPAVQLVIPEEGMEILPPVPKSAIPSGTWICDMGTVHYASGHEGACPICGMKLTLKP